MHQRRQPKNQREGASPSPSGGGDVRGNCGIWVAEQVLRGGLPKPLFIFAVKEKE